MIRRPPRSTLFPYNDALPISAQPRLAPGEVSLRSLPRRRGRSSSWSRRKDRKSTRLNSSHVEISYAVFCLKKKKKIKKKTKATRVNGTSRQVDARATSVLTIG